MIIELGKETYGFLMPSGDMVEVGDKELTSFRPHLKLNRWGGECFIEPSIEQTGLTEVTPYDDRVESESNLSIIKCYPIAPSEQWELGSFRMEITHKTKPISNKIVSRILGNNVVSHYQPPLTQQEIEEGCFRPDNIVGSYAFYHAAKGVMNSSRGKDYKAGKFGHKPRPRVIDDNGDWVWADLFIDLKTGVQIITIPQEFLEYAKYPIKHDAGADTFGYTTKGGTSVETGADKLDANKYPCGEVGTATSISLYLKQYSGTPLLSYAVYDDSTGYPGAKNGVTDEWTLTSGWDDWKLINIATGGSLSVADFWLIFWLQSDLVTNYYDSAGVRYYKSGEDYDIGWPANFPAGGTSSTRKTSIYCTYTPTAGGWANIANMRMGTGSVTATDIANIRMGTGSIAVADIAKIGGVAV